MLCQNVPKENSSDKNDMMGQEKIDMRFTEGILTIYLHMNTNLSMFLFAAMNTMNPAVMF